MREVTLCWDRNLETVRVADENKVVCTRGDWGCIGRLAYNGTEVESAEKQERLFVGSANIPYIHPVI